MKKLLALGLLVALASAVSALPTTLGQSGGLVVMDASVQQGVALTVSDYTDGGFKIPLTQLEFGVLPNLELGAQFQDWDNDATWGVNAKYILPFSIAKGKLAAGLSYLDSDYAGVEWAGTVSGTWPVFAASTFTAAVLFDRNDGDNQTAYEAALVKNFKNGSALGLEYYFNLPLINDYFLPDYGDFGTAYLTFPVNEMLGGRVALSGIGQDTSVIASVSAKF
jgi:hypothetical protein